VELDSNLNTWIDLNTFFKKDQKQPVNQYDLGILKLSK